VLLLCEDACVGVCCCVIDVCWSFYVSACVLEFVVFVVL